MNELHLCLANYIYMLNTAPRLLKGLIIIQAEMGRNALYIATISIAIISIATIGIATSIIATFPGRATSSQLLTRRDVTLSEHHLRLLLIPSSCSFLHGSIHLF